MKIFLVVYFLFFILFCLVLPNVWSLVVFFIAHILMQIQTRLEEEYLEKMHGASYVDYKNKVRRWL